MAADIIGYDIDIVPVGKDQKQHVEMARDIAKAFNATYKTDFFVIPKEQIGKDIGTIPGLDGRKMSKSYGNTIGVFDDEKTLKKKVMSIPTDSTPLEEPKDPDTCNVFSLIKFFGKPAQIKAVREKYLAGNYGYGHAKMELLGILVEYLRPYQERYTYLRQNPHIVEERLKK
jgi:tryptophanyl-tRNA synthetase